MKPLNKKSSTRFSPLLLGLHSTLMTLRALSAASGLSVVPAWGRQNREPFPLPFQNAFQEALLKESQRCYASFLKGVQLYESAPRSSRPEMPAPIWEKGSSKLFDLGQKYQVTKAQKALFWIPSLINRSYIFDLNESSGFLSYLAQQGIKSYLFDWGHNSHPSEALFSLKDFLEKRLQPAFMAASARHQKPLGLGGYCMGGVLATALKAKVPSPMVSSLSLLATPWNFHAGPFDPQLMKNIAHWSRLFFSDQSHIPASFLQLLFHLQNPFKIQKKFQSFYQQSSGSQLTPVLRSKLNRFLALEDWLNDTVPIPLKVFMECCEHWYGNNIPFVNKTLASTPLTSLKSGFPACLVTPKKDQLVPSQSSLGLLSLFPQATVLKPDTGHVGLFGSSNAQTVFWKPYANWLKQVLD